MLDAAASEVQGLATATPSIARRLAGFVYEGVLLFGVVMIAGLVYSLAANQRHAVVGSIGLQLSLFLVLGVYFVYFWSRHGQTLAMKTWRMRLVGPDGRPPGTGRAVARYLLAWMWFVPALALTASSGLKGGLAVSGVIGTGVLAYASLTFLRRDRQYFHDVLCGTRIVDDDAIKTRR